MFSAYAGLARTAEYLSCSLHVAILGFRKAWWSLGSRTSSRVLASSMFQETESGSCQFHKAQAWKLAQHHFHCILPSKAVTEPTQILEERR